MSVCQHCGSTNLVSDHVGAENVKICGDCGGVQDSENLIESENYGQVGYALSTSTTLEKKYGVSVDRAQSKFAKGARVVLKKMEDYTTRYANGSLIYEEVELKFAEMLEKRQYHRSQYKNKMAIATACLIFVLRSHECKVLIDEVCSELGIETRNITKILRQLGQKEATVSQDIIGSIFSETPSLSSNIRQTTEDIIKFLDTVHLNSSFTRRAVAISALYFAYISEPPLASTPMHLTKFCEIFNFKVNIVKVLCRETKRKFLLLAKRLPWAPAKVTEFKYHMHIRNIIKCKRALLSESSNDTTVPFVNKRAIKKEGEDPPSKILITEQMVLEMPPCAIRSLKNPREETNEPEPANVSTSETLDEKDLDEEELKQYIRTDQEVEIAKRLKKLVDE